MSQTLSMKPDDDVAAAYRQVLQTLVDAGMPFLVGGAYAFACHTGIERDTKDLDLFVMPDDYPKVEALLRGAGHHTELTYPHWLGKVRAGGADIDVIFNSGNGITEVDAGWFEHAVDAEVLGVPVKLVPVEEIIWSKAFVMERERYDGADVAHLLRYQAHALDWHRLAFRMEPHWRVLLSHLVLFGFIYPAERERVPRWLMAELIERLHAEMLAPPPDSRLCQGTLLSREQYLHDVEKQGYRDARATRISSMTRGDIANWTEAISER